MGKGMRRDVYFHQDPTYEEAAANCRKEEREKRKQEAARKRPPVCPKKERKESKQNQPVQAIKVLYNMRQLAKAAGYRVVSDITLRNEKTGHTYKSFYEGR